MRRTMMKSKIHSATVTEANLNYEGSITIDERLMEAANLLEFELVQVYNINNGERFETYVISGEKDSGVICLNGAAARKVAVGDKIIIVSYASYEEEELKVHSPRIVLVDEENRIKSIKGETLSTA